MSRSVLLSLTCAITLFTAACDRESENPAQQPESSTAGNEGESATLVGEIDRSHAGEPLPQFSVIDPQGITLDLVALEGQPALINLWATWCAPCVIEMPMLDELAGESDTLRVLTISQDLQGAEVVQPFFEERDLANLQPWLDPENNLAFHYGGGGSVLPTTILYDAEGKEVWRMIGGYDWSSPEARALIDEALDG